MTRLAVAALVLSLLTPAGAAAEERPMVRRGPFLRAPTYDAWLENLRTFPDSSYDTSTVVRALGTLEDEDLARLPPVVAKLLPDAKGTLQYLLVLLVRTAAPRGVGPWADVVPGLARLSSPEGVRGLRAVATSATDGAGAAREALRAALERDPKTVTEVLLERPSSYDDHDRVPLSPAQAALAAELLVPRLASAKAEQRIEAASRLTWVQPPTPAQVEALAALVRGDPEPRVRDAALHALVRLRRNAVPGEPAVAPVALLLHELLPDPARGEAALEALCVRRDGEPAPPLAPLEALVRTSPRGRGDAIAVLGALGAAGRPAAPTLLWALQELPSDERKALALLTALRDVGALATPEACAALVREFQHTSGHGRRHELLPLLTAAGPGAAELVPALLAHAPGCWEDPCGALEALAALAPGDARVQAVVVEVLAGETTGRQRAGALVAWTRLGCPERARCVPRVLTVHDAGIERALAAGPALVDALLDKVEAAGDEEFFKRLLCVGMSSTPERAVEPILRSRGLRAFDPFKLLVHFGPAAASAVPELTRLLEYGLVTGEQADNAALVLAAIGPAAAPAVPALLIARGRARSPEAYLLALTRIGPAALPALDKLAADEDRHLASAALMAADDMEPRPVAAMRAMITRHGVVATHGSQLRVLRDLAQDEAGVAWLLELVAGAADRGVASSALLALGELRAQGALAPSLAILEAQGPLDEEAGEVLWRLGTPAVAPLAALLDHEEVAVALAARSCLQRMTHAYRAAADAGLRSRHPAVRAWAELEAALLRGP